MAKKKKKGGFAYMDFLIVGGIATVAYFLFSSFSKGPIKPTVNPEITPPVTPPVTPPTTPIIAPSGGTGGTTVDVVYFTDKEKKDPILRYGQPANDSKIIRALQIFLTKAGWDTKGIDGVYGDNTEAALKGYLRWTSLLPVVTSLERLGIDSAKFSTKQVFGYDPNDFILNFYEEYIGSVKGWQQTPDSIKAYTGTL
jgi:hypothetical protein